MPGAASYARIGPTAFPYVIAAVLFVLSIWTAFAALRGDFPEREEQNIAPMVWIVGGLAAQMLLLKVAGFSIATGLLFAATARGFGQGSAVDDNSDRHRACVHHLGHFRQGTAVVAAGWTARTSRFSRQVTDNGYVSPCWPWSWSIAFQPINLFYALIGVTLGHGGRRAAGHRAGADGRAAAAGHLQARSGRFADHVCRHLLRRHVWRLDHIDPARTRRAKAPRSSPRSKATRWRAPAAVARRWRRPRSAPSSPA